MRGDEDSCVPAGRRCVFKIVNGQYIAENVTYGGAIVSEGNR